jgi:hypothetical protein
MAMRMEAAHTLFQVQVPSFDPISTRAWMRLIKAVVLSFLLHLALLVGLPVNPTGGVPQVGNHDHRPPRASWRERAGRGQCGRRARGKAGAACRPAAQACYRA